MSNPAVNISGIKISLTVDEATSLLDALTFVASQTQYFSIVDPLKKKLRIALKGNVGYAPVTSI